MKYHAGILHGMPEWDRFQLLVLVHTPGVPLEWVYAGAGLGWRRRAKLRAMIDANQTDEWREFGRDNAASIEPGDGLAMLRAVCPRYVGAAPMWSQLELQNDTRSDAEIAAGLGVDRQRVRRWRVNAVFDPLTGVRLRPNRGTPLV